MSANDPKRTWYLFGGDAPIGVQARFNFSPNNVDVTTQVVHLVREIERKLYFAEGILYAFDLGLFVDQMPAARI